MTTLWKYSYYVYLVIVAILIIEGVLRLNENLKMGMILIGIGALVLVKFFMTRRIRRNIQKRNQQN